MKKDGEALLLDAGDLFFRKFSAPFSEKEIPRLEERARLILRSFEWMGYHAMGIGDDDLSLGKRFLAELSKASKMLFLSTNVIDEDSGKTLFQRFVLKEVRGLKVGIFSLLSPEVFIGASDPRKKGLIFRNPIETAREMVVELGPRTDLIILLSHLGYPKDVELAQKVSGIHLIVGGHTGVHLVNPPVFGGTVLLHTSPKGMYASRLDLTLLHKASGFYNVATKRSLEENLRRLQQQLTARKASDAEKQQQQKAKESVEKALQQLRGENNFTHRVFALSESIKDHPDIKKMIEDHQSRFPEKTEPPLHDSRGTYRPKP